MYTGPNIVRDGLVLYLDAKNSKSYSGSGNVWYDLSVNSKQASLISNPVFSDGIFTFNGSTSYVTIPDFDYGRSGCTICAFVNFYLYNVGQWKTGVFSKWQTGAGFNNEFSIGSTDGANSPGYAAFSIQNTNNQIVSTIDYSELMQVNKWYYLVGTFDGSYSRIYVNGEYRATSPISTSSIISTIIIQPISIASFGENMQYTGYQKISQASIYSRPLTSEEIHQNYIALKSRFGL